VTSDVKRANIFIPYLKNQITKYSNIYLLLKPVHTLIFLMLEAVVDS